MAMPDIMLQVIPDALIGGTDFPRFDNAHAFIGIGDGTALVTSAQTDLQGVNTFRFAVDAGFPTRDTATLTFQGSVGEADGNFSVQELAIFNAATGGQIMLRWLQDLGTKTNAVAWTVTTTVEWQQPA